MNKIVYEQIINSINKLVKHNPNNISRETAQFGYNKALQLLKEQDITKQEKQYRKKQANNLKNYLTDLDKITINKILKDINDSNISDVILLDKQTYLIFSITPELYKENKKLLNNYIPIGMCINNNSEITVMANTTIKYDNNISHYLNNENIQFKIRSYDSTINFNNYNKINWVNSSSNDFNYLIEHYDIIKNSIKLTNVCKFDNVNDYIGIDIKNKKYPYYNFKKNKITRLKLQDNIYIRPILHLNKK